MQVVPPWALVLLALSKRMHSIFLLRLFNDGVAMLLAFIATGTALHAALMSRHELLQHPHLAKPVNVNTCCLQ